MPEGHGRLLLEFVFFLFGCFHDRSLVVQFSWSCYAQFVDATRVALVGECPKYLLGIEGAEK